MITQIEGRLLAVRDGAAHVRCGDLTYEVFIPAADSLHLATMVGQTVTFHTLYYLEGQGQGSSFWPRLIGFQSRAGREFFELFTTVKGIGNRKALRALQLPFVRVAEAVAERDLATLQALPEIGKRTAEAICVELKGRIEPFVHALRSVQGSAHAPRSRAKGSAADDGGTTGAANGTANGITNGAAGDAAGKARSTGARKGAQPEGTPAPDAEHGAPRGELVLMANSAVEVLVQLGYPKPDARTMVERVLMVDEPPGTASEIVTAALR